MRNSGTMELSQPRHDDAYSVPVTSDANDATATLGLASKPHVSITLQLVFGHRTSCHISITPKLKIPSSTWFWHASRGAGKRSRQAHLNKCFNISVWKEPRSRMLKAGWVTCRCTRQLGTHCLQSAGEKPL